MKRNARLLSVFLILLICFSLSSVLPDSAAAATSSKRGLEGAWKGVLPGSLHDLVGCGRGSRGCKSSSVAASDVGKAGWDAACRGENT